ncbi:MAG: ribonuclease Z [Solitalea-like symbiont of Tyrophagus putrescentiae]
MEFKILILGNGSAIPKLGYHPHSQLLFHDTDKGYLIDCGESTQMRLIDNAIRFNKITKIFITHLHGDHFFGLFGLLSSMSLLQRKKALDIYAPQGLKKIIDTIFNISVNKLNYSINIHEVNTTKYSVISSDNSLEVYSIPLAHSIPCCGFLFKEIRKTGFDKNKIKRYDLKPSLVQLLKEDKDIVIDGKIFKPHFFKHSTPKSARSYAYITDTMYTESIIPLIKNVDLMYHEATYAQDAKERAPHTYHSTAKQAALIAKKAEVKKLIIGHLSNRYNSPILHIDEAQEIFQNSHYAQQYTYFDIP